MVKKFLKKRSKRVSCRTRYKIEHKVREHNRKLRREAKKNPKKRGPPKDPGVPNSLPFKDKILQEAQLRKEREEELKRKQKEDRHKLVMEKRGLADLTKDAAKRADKFEAQNAALKREEIGETQKAAQRNFKTFYREFNKVIEAADVILEVLDARDPLGSRCPQVEKAVLEAGPDKRLVLVLNKIDLVPSNNLVEWLKYLRNEFPAVPFKASTQLQRSNLSCKKYRLGNQQTSATATSCLGADLLMKLLGNYCRSKDIRTSIRVGVVGFPNVGKSSIINSLKRSRACNVGATPGVTRKMQEIQLDKHIVLLDSPGVVLAFNSADEAGTALRNALKVEQINDVMPAVEAILRRANVEQLMLYYGIAHFRDSGEFLVHLANRLKRVKKGGVPDVEAAAKSLLVDWNTGKIKYFTKPPEMSESSTHVSAEIVATMAAEFDLDSLVKMETDEISGLRSSYPVREVDVLEMAGTGLTEGTSEGVRQLENYVDDESKPMDSDSITGSQDVIDPIGFASVRTSSWEGEVAHPRLVDQKRNFQYFSYFSYPLCKFPIRMCNFAFPDVVHVKTKPLGEVEKTEVQLNSKKSRRRAKKTAKQVLLEEKGLKPSEALLDGNQQLNAANKQALKKLKRNRKRTNKLTEKLSDNLSSALSFTSSKTEGEDYNFETDYQ